MDRAELLREIDATWDQLDGVVSALRPAEWELQADSEESAGSPWTIKDTVLHIAAWKRNGLRVAIMQEAGEPPEDRYPTEILGIDRDAFNQQLWEVWRNAPISAVMAEHQGSHAELRALLEALTEERLLVTDRPRHWLRPLLRHPREHLEAQIHPALAAATSDAPRSHDNPTTA